MDGETRRAETILENAGFPKKSGEMVLVQSKTATVKDPAFKAAIKDVAKTVGGCRSSPTSRSDTVSADKHSALVQFDLKGDPDTAIDRSSQPSTRPPRSPRVTRASPSSSSATPA